MTTIHQLVLNHAEGTGTFQLRDSSAVVFDTAQALTDAQKLQARQNIGAAAQEDIPAGGTGGVSSWNDLTDKPFYAEDTREVLLAEQEPEFLLHPTFGLYVVADTKTFSLETDQTYTVSWDGETYVCTGVDASALNSGAEMIAIGNGTAFGMSGNGEPFIIATNDTTLMLCAADPNDTAATHKVALWKGAVTVKTLDAMFLPMEAIDARIEAYIASALEGDY